MCSTNYFLSLTNSLKEGFLSRVNTKYPRHFLPLLKRTKNTENKYVLYLSTGAYVPTLPIYPDLCYKILPIATFKSAKVCPWFGAFI